MLDADASVRYAGRHEIEVLAHSANILGVVGYGAGRPESLAPGCPFVAAPLLPFADGGMFEIWSAPLPVRPFRLGRVAGAFGDAVAFGAVTLDEALDGPLEAAVEAAYSGIFDFLDASGFTAPLRFWNYLTAITGDARGMERYRRFNIGRHRAFAARLRQPAPPPASGVGGHAGASVIYFLAGRAPGTPVENPRQTSAYHYPPLYGPLPPSFSRASLYRNGGSRILFVSGTASIVGHETRHAGDLTAQIAETMQNLRAVIAAAGAPPGGAWAVKIYLNDPGFHALVQPAVTSLFGADSQQLYLHGEICRVDLLLEVEAVGVGFDPRPGKARD